ncbi:transposase [Lederbergia galactosidilytica]|uniref:transposase n=1 Tax=Lederbergia galactosidilytica TaxID=217031 RepID=UPI0007DAF784|nr:transposase [Lederbergia galactosidilytica]
MLTKNQINEREQLEMLTIEQLVPQEHLVRKLDAAIDFSFIYPLVEDLYSTIGRPCIDPVVLIKMTFIQYTFGIRSMRQTIKEIETNVAYRWFLGFHTGVPHFSTFGKNYVRRFADTDLFEQIFYKVLNEVANRGLLSPDHVFIDSTHVKASANKRKFKKNVVRKETIERVFADAKEKHGLRWTTLRRLKKMSMQAMLTFAALHLKKLASWTWKTPIMA